jgi:class 3 adenylate cyclase
VITCPSCGEENGEKARFCQACGSPLAQDTAPVREERRVVSILFVDLVGSTSLGERLDPEDVRALLTRYYDRARAEIERFGGTVEKFIGDAVMAMFGAPIAHGDDAERAVRAALAVCDSMADMDAADPLLELQVRAAVNTGEAIVELDARPETGMAMVAGDVVNTAARLQSNAPVNGVIVGQETYASTRTVIAYEPAEPIVAKGKAEPVPAWIAVGPLVEAGERVFSEVPIVGRHDELGALRSMWATVSSERRCRLVTMFGPAGIGKSRLAHELAHEVATDGGLAIRGRSQGYADSGPYSAFAQQVQHIAGIYGSDDPSEALTKLRDKAAALAVADDPQEVADQVAILSGIPGAEAADMDRASLFFGARVFVEAVARERPTLLAFEDIHFADDSLLDLVEFLAAHVQDVPLLLIATARPELLTTRPTWAGGLLTASALPLAPLTEEEAAELAGRLFEQRGLGDLEDSARSLAASSDGNPLFIEELTSSLAERSTRDLQQVPGSIRGIVAARLDALPPQERSVVLDASVVGKLFWRGALTRLRPDREDLPAALDALERRDLIRREASSTIKGDQQFSFKHGLIREVAYLTLPREERRRCHEVTASFLEEVAAVGTADADATLAYHWREAGLPDKALGYLLTAADTAVRGWAKARAARLYALALELIPEGDADLRRDVVKKRALAAAAAMHIPDMARQQRRADEAPA